MKIRLWKFWLHFCFFTSKCSQHTKTQSCNSGASGKKVRSHRSRSGALLNYGKATSPQQHPVLQPKEEKVGDILCLLSGHKQWWAHMSPNTWTVSGLLSMSLVTHSWKCYWPFTWTQNEKLVGPAPLVPGTTLHLLHWKAYNHFPWKNERLCQFACTLLQLKTIRRFQSIVLQ